MSDGAQLLEQMPLTAPELIAALAQHEQQAAVLALAVRRLENAGTFGEHGAVNSASWMADNCRMSLSTARSWVHRGRFLDRFSVVADAAVAHSLSADQVAAMQRLNRPKYEQLLSESIAMLTEVLAPLDVKGTVTSCALWRQKADAVIDETAPPVDKERSLSMSRAGDGALLGRFELDDAAGTELEKAIATAVTFEGDDDTRTLAERQGDALFDIAAFFNTNHDNGDGTGRHLPHIT
ncbi:MAG: DUF222 domain-containing protein, partial [Actinomycetota bacterium]|nr:DUF222 domain-containing protein [Actinomycetota bacterium]